MISQTSQAARSGLSGPVAGQVAPGPLSDAFGIGEGVGADAAFDVLTPPLDLFVEQGAQGGLPSGRAMSMAKRLGPLLDGSFDLNVR